MKKRNLILKLLLLIPLMHSIPSKAVVSDYIPESVKNHPILSGLLSASTLGVSYGIYKYFTGYEERWNWAELEKKDEKGKSIVNSIVFPSNFYFGTASSATQTEGDVTAHGGKSSNSWTKDEEQRQIPLEHRVGSATGHWDLYKEDIQLAKDLTFTLYRYSIEWSKIEPQEGCFDQDAMQHYIDYTKELIRQGLRPMPTLFHHAWPNWLHNGFEDRKSVKAFKKFAIHVFNKFNEADLLDKTDLWLTFNEPAGYALAAYVYGKYPPRMKFQFKLCGTVLKNMLDAHVAVYKAFKKINSNVKISLAHMMQPIQPYNPWNPLDVLPAKIFDYLLNDITLIYLSTGKFKWLGIINEYNPEAKGTLDFIGVNYYTHTLLNNFKTKVRPTELVGEADEGEQGKAMYAEGFYSSLKKVAKLLPGMPIIVTENGFPTTNEDLFIQYLQRHLYVIHKAMQEGMDIRGYLLWTLTDTYGWNRTNSQFSKYGIYKVDPKTLERTPKERAKYLKKIAKKSAKSSETLADQF